MHIRNVNLQRSGSGLLVEEQLFKFISEVDVAGEFEIITVEVKAVCLPFP